ncbi:MAG: NAD(P)/FAD-dependent oxidoreductase [Acidimicrobiales bacterium]|nr:NAD(P)/FAD-dependent oxidoreductase [Acidimicrobiales bacterium]
MQDERFDIVVVGGGHNGSTIAAYLAKCGLSVCVLEERSECGGGQENTEARPGFRIDPHATYLYGAAAPGFEQLELAKYGFRMVYYQSMAGLVTLDGVAANLGGRFNREVGLESLRRFTGTEPVDAEGIFMASMGDDGMRDLLRALFWTPPFPSDYEIEPKDAPWWKVFRQLLPEFWTDRLVDMSFIDFLDEFVPWEPLRAFEAFAAWYCGAHPSWDGMMLPSLGGTLLVGFGSGSPRGGMHTYAHAIIRSAIANGARIITNAQVGEIIVKDGRAVGVQLNDEASFPEKTVWANKAVISAVDVKQTFTKLVGKSHLDASFVQKVRDVSLKGGSLFVLSVIVENYLSITEIAISSQNLFIHLVWQHLLIQWSFSTHKPEMLTRLKVLQS